MDNVFVAVYLIVGLVLRLGIPIGLTLLLAWYLRQLDARWRAEAAQNGHHRAVAADLWLATPCWEFNACSAERRANCPAAQNNGRPCWEHFARDGQLAPLCAACDYRQSVMPLAAAAQP
ncbi:MAG: hypothetical protein HYZ26_04360 [Chloroflexi bacterium]|nr:hypothetical protein [Chloroflexota bacterium]